jgi:CelD/BcsL family acetyltransferase involved in cellulose biosynthesis
MDGILQDCFERGLAEIDFLRGVEAWKEPLTDQVRRTVRLVAFQGSIRGRIARQSVLGGRRRDEALPPGTGPAS